MDRAGDELLPGAGLTQNQNGRVRGRNEANFLKNRFQGSARSHDRVLLVGMRNGNASTL